MRARNSRYAVQQRRNTCWPLSNQAPWRSNDQVAPPRRGRRSSSLTAAPASTQLDRRGQAREPAADDHDPGPVHAPTRVETAVADGSSPAMLRARDPHPFPRRQRHASLEDGAGSGRDAGQQPAIDAGHGGDARPAPVVEQGEQLQPLVEPLPCPDGFEGDQGRDRVGRSRQVGVGPEPDDVVGRQVDASDLPVLDDVAQDVGELQGDAQGVGELRGPRPAGGAEHRQGEPADRAGHEATVHDQRGEGRVRDTDGVVFAAFDEIVEGVPRHGVVPAGVGERDEHGIVVRGMPAAQGVDVATHHRERRQFLVGRTIAVADVVDPAGERVDRRHRRSLRRWEQADPEGEVLRLGAGDLVAASVRVVASHAATRPATPTCTVRYTVRTRAPSAARRPRARRSGHARSRRGPRDHRPRIRRPPAAPDPGGCDRAAVPPGAATGGRGRPRGPRRRGAGPMPRRPRAPPRDAPNRSRSSAGR